VFRRKWPSIYEAIQDTRPDRDKLMELYIKQIPVEGRILLAGDHTAWSINFRFWIFDFRLGRKRE